jgi:hypothetical protein
MKKVWLFPILFALITGTCIQASAQNTSALPVTLTMDAGLAGSNKVAISWTILIKLETDYFDVEKSQDGISWHSIAVIRPDSNTAVPFTYTSFDVFPVRGANFYRIRVQDLTGRTSFTPVKTVRVATFCNIAVYPNPSSGQVNISLGQVPASDWYVSLITLTGQTILQKKYSRNNIAVCLPVNNIPPGDYILEITDGNSKQQKRLLINHS